MFHLHVALNGLDGLRRRLPVRGHDLEEPLAQFMQLKSVSVEQRKGGSMNTANTS